MTTPGSTPHITECHLRDGPDDAAREQACLAAIWAEGPDEARARLAAYVKTTPYRLIWAEGCVPAVEYVRRHGRQAEVGGLVRAVHAGHRVELGPLDAKDAAVEAKTFRDALLAIDYKAAPVFAVLDGAQFDHLPNSLFDGDFLSRSLYLDRGENDPDQIITAPHMVTLDERSEKPTGRSYEDTVDALLALLDDRPAAVFWQCEGGADVLYKHLRSINMVLYPKAALDDWEEPEPKDGAPPQTPDTHTPVLFRHADANVMAQIVPALTDAETARLFGPASTLHYEPDAAWGDAMPWLRSVADPAPKQTQKGPLRLCMETIERMDIRCAEHSRRKVHEYLKEAAPEYLEKLSAKEIETIILKAEKAGDDIGLESEHAYGLWTYLTLITGQEILGNPHVVAHFTEDARPSDDVLDELFDRIANASDDELEAWS